MDIVESLLQTVHDPDIPQIEKEAAISFLVTWSDHEGEADDENAKLSLDVTTKSVLNSFLDQASSSTEKEIALDILKDSLLALCIESPQIDDSRLFERTLQSVCQATLNLIKKYLDRETISLAESFGDKLLTLAKENEFKRMIFQTPGLIPELFAIFQLPVPSDKSSCELKGSIAGIFMALSCNEENQLAFFDTYRVVLDQLNQASRLGENTEIRCWSLGFCMNLSSNSLVKPYLMEMNAFVPRLADLVVRGESHFTKLYAITTLANLACHSGPLISSPLIIDSLLFLVFHEIENDDLKNTAVRCLKSLRHKDSGVKQWYQIYKDRARCSENGMPMLHLQLRFVEHALVFQKFFTPKYSQALFKSLVHLLDHGGSEGTNRYSERTDVKSSNLSSHSSSWFLTGASFGKHDTAEDLRLEMVADWVTHIEIKRQSSTIWFESFNGIYLDDLINKLHKLQSIQKSVFSSSWVIEEGNEDEEQDCWSGREEEKKEEKQLSPCSSHLSMSEGESKSVLFLLPNLVFLDSTLKGNHHRTMCALEVMNKLSKLKTNYLTKLLKSISEEIGITQIDSFLLNFQFAREKLFRSKINIGTAPISPMDLASNSSLGILLKTRNEARSEFLLLGRRMKRICDLLKSEFETASFRESLNRLEDACSNLKRETIVRPQVSTFTWDNPVKEVDPLLPLLVKLQEQIETLNTMVEIVLEEEKRYRIDDDFIQVLFLKSYSFLKVFDPRSNFLSTIIFGTSMLEKTQSLEDEIRNEEVIEEKFQTSLGLISKVQTLKKSFESLTSQERVLLNALKSKGQDVAVVKARLDQVQLKIQEIIKRKATLDSELKSLSRVQDSTIDICDFPELFNRVEFEFTADELTFLSSLNGPQIDGEEEGVVEELKNSSLKSLGLSLETATSDCSICFGPGTRKKVIQCGHAFCEECVERLLDSKRICPVCRVAITLVIPLYL